MSRSNDSLETKPGKPRKRLLRRVMVIGFVFLVLGLIASWFVAGMLIAPNQAKIGRPPEGLPAVDITLESESGSTVHGWHVRSEGRKGVIVLLHPIRGSRLTMLERAKFLFAEGYSIVMIDLQGHGESIGENITVGHLEKHDAAAALQFAKENHPNEKVGVIGISLGGASALSSASTNIDALIIESVFPAIDVAVENRVTSKLGPLGIIPAKLLLLQLSPRLGISTDELRPKDFIPKLQCPIFVMSGVEDHHTTAAETKEMYAAAPQPKELWLVEGAAHEDLYDVAAEEYKRRVLNFFNQHLHP